MAITDTLQKIGLNPKEIKVYLNLIKSGRTKPSILSKITKINRPTVYNILKSLLSYGLISEDRSDKTLFFTPLPLDSLEKLTAASKRELKEKESLIKKAIGELSLITADKYYPIPKIRLVSENDLEKFLYDNLEKWQDEIIKSDSVWWGYQDHSFVENYEEWIRATWQTKQSNQEHYTGKILSNVSKIEQKLEGKYPKSKRNIRFMDGLNFTATMWVCGDYLIMITTNQHPFYLLEIHDNMLAHNTREIFKKLWILNNS